MAYVSADQITNETDVRAALFPIAKDKRVEGGPQLSGMVNITENDVINLAAWKKQSDKKVDYYSLSVGDKGRDGKGLTLNGAIFPEKDKKSDKSPDYSGKLNLQDKTTLRVVGWKKVSAEGRDYISLQIHPHREKQDAGAEAAPQAATTAVEDDDSIPF